MGNILLRLLQNYRHDCKILCRSFLAILPSGPETSPNIKLLRRMLTASQEKFGNSGGEIDTNVEILFVATQKDFSVLPLAIEGALCSIDSINDTMVTVVVPDIFVEQCLDLVKNFPRVRVESEDFFISFELRDRIDNKFGWRAGWVVQQLIKLGFVMKSKSNGVLVVDSDTILLQERDWLYKDETQLLLPVWELHKPYYEFLHELDWSTLDPEHTFVAHQMLMQPRLLFRLFESSSFGNLDRFVDYLLEKPYSDMTSPFSIDYELYAQNLCLNHFDKVRLEKWSNVSISRSSLPDDMSFSWIYKKYGRRFASVSLHSYL